MAKTNWNYDLIYNIRAVAKTSVEIQRHHYLTPHIVKALRNLDRRLLLKDSRRHQNKDLHHEWRPEPLPQRTTRWVTTLPTPYPTYEGRPVPRSPPSSTTSEVSETASTIVPPNSHRQSPRTADTVEEQWYWDTVEDKKEARQRYLALGSDTPKTCNKGEARGAWKNDVFHKKKPDQNDKGGDNGHSWCSASPAQLGDAGHICP
jgi:hypothetical protein